MIDVKSTNVITVSTSKVIPIVTEPKYKQVAVIKNTSGDSQNLKSHQINKGLIKFLEASGLTVEYQDAIVGHKGKTILNNVPVKISPILHTNYDGGAYIKVEEVDATDETNTRKVMKFLRKSGIDITRYCSVTGNGKSCLALLKGEE